MNSYSVWYLGGDYKEFRPLSKSRIIQAKCIRDASKKVREWSDRRDYLIAKKGTYEPEPGGGPLVLFPKKDGDRYYKNLRVKGLPLVV